MISINMIARDSEDTIVPCLKSVLPYVNSVHVGIDSRSKDGTVGLVKELMAEYKNLDFQIYPIGDNPKVDLVKMRQELLDKTTEKWVWIVDSDEYYPDDVVFGLLGALDGNYPEYALRCWAIWDSAYSHRASSMAVIPRIFLNDDRHWWRGLFGKETLHCNGTEIVLLRLRYIHLTHLKKDNWREEMNQRRIADGKHLMLTPKRICNEVRKIFGGADVPEPRSYTPVG